MMHKAWRSIEVPYCFFRSSIKFHGHTGGKIDDMNPIWEYLAGRSYQIPQICLVKVRAFKFCTVFELIMLLNISSVFYLIPICLFLAATKQLYEWFSPSVCLSVRPSVCLSVRPSVCHTFLTMFPSSYHHEIFRSYYQWQKWRPCKRSRSEVKGQGHRGHNPT